MQRLAVRGVGIEGSALRSILLACTLAAATVSLCAAQHVRLLDVTPGPFSSHPSGLVKLGERLFFAAASPIPESSVWTSDGTAAGTYHVADVCTEDCFLVFPWRFVAAGGLVFFDAGENGDQHRGLWRTDGTADGTFQVGFCDDPDAMTAVGDSLFFSCVDAAAGRELWTSDGTVAGTHRVEDIYPGPGDGLDWCQEDYGCMTGVGGTLFFNADDGVHGAELWKSDGTSAGTMLVADLDPGPDNSWAAWMTPFDDALFFSLGRTCFAGDLWRSDGTELGTEIVALPPLIAALPSSISRPGTRLCPLSWGPRFLTALGDHLFFTTGDVLDGESLWRTDGTTEGTAAVAEGLDYVHVLGASSRWLYFWLFGQQTSEIWASDGTSAGTGALRHYGESVRRVERAFLGDRLFFTAWDLTTGVELWSSDGTAAGTVLVEDLAPGPGNFAPKNLTGGDGPLFFTGYDPDLGLELWVLDSWDVPFDLDVSRAGTGSGTVTSQPAGIVCGGDCQQAYPYGTRVALLPVPVYGSQFEGWTGHEDCADSRLTLFDDRACTALFGPCSETEVLDLAGTTIDDSRQLTACNEIRAGPAVSLMDTAEAEMRAGNQVVFPGSFAMAADARLAVEIGPPE